VGFSFLGVTIMFIGLKNGNLMLNTDEVNSVELFNKQWIVLLKNGMTYKLDYDPLELMATQMIPNTEGWEEILIVTEGCQDLWRHEIKIQPIICFTMTAYGKVQPVTTSMVVGGYGYTEAFGNISRYMRDKYGRIYGDDCEDMSFANLEELIKAKYSNGDNNESVIFSA
jgi:hypothetical protein